VPLGWRSGIPGQAGAGCACRRSARGARDGITRTLKILALPPSRLSAKQLPDFVADLTPAAEYERAKQASLEQRLARQRSEGRPTKKERRDLAALFDREEP